jgi:hypothetical protein
MPSYQIKFDENYMAERAQRLYFEKDAGFSFAKMRICALVLFAVSVPLFVWWGRMDAVVVSAVGGVCIALVPVTQRWELRRKMVKSPMYGQDLSIQLDERGFGMTETVSGTLDWSAFTKASRVSDGFLLTTSQTTWWLPDAELVECTADDVQKLIRANVREYKD